MNCSVLKNAQSIYATTTAVDAAAAHRRRRFYFFDGCLHDVIRIRFETDNPFEY